MNVSKKKISILITLMLASLIIGCIGTDKKQETTGSSIDSIAKAESTGIFSEKFADLDNNAYRYEATYNNGYELKIETPFGLICSLTPKDRNSKQTILVNMDGTKNYGKGMLSTEDVIWDREGRIDPRSDNTLVDGAKEFLNACERKDKEMRERQKLSKTK